VRRPRALHLLHRRHDESGVVRGSGVRHRATVVDMGDTSPSEWGSYQELIDELRRRLGAATGITTLSLEREAPLTGGANPDGIDVLWEVQGASYEGVRLLFECHRHARRITQQALRSWRSIVDDVWQPGMVTVGVMPPSASGGALGRRDEPLARVARVTATVGGTQAPPVGFDFTARIASTLADTPDPQSHLVYRRGGALVHGRLTERRVPAVLPGARSPGSLSRRSPGSRPRRAPPPRRRQRRGRRRAARRARP
jgi:hypothetical protein